VAGSAAAVTVCRLFCWLVGKRHLLIREGFLERPEPRLGKHGANGRSFGSGRVGWQRDVGDRRISEDTSDPRQRFGFLERHRIELRFNSSMILDSNAAHHRLALPNKVIAPPNEGTNDRHDGGTDQQRPQAELEARFHGGRSQHAMANVTPLTDPSIAVHPIGIKGCPTASQIAASVVVAKPATPTPASIAEIPRLVYWRKRPQSGGVRAWPFGHSSRPDGRFGADTWAAGAGVLNRWEDVSE
jgi:hypothetical protein